MRQSHKGVGGWVCEQGSAAALVFIMGQIPTDKVLPVLWGVLCTLLVLFHTFTLSNQVVRAAVLFSGPGPAPVPLWADFVCDAAIVMGFVAVGHPVVAVLHALACICGVRVKMFVLKARFVLGDEFPAYQAEWERIRAKEVAARKGRS
jgi:hypothetical protein